MMLAGFNCINDTGFIQFLACRVKCFVFHAIVPDTVVANEPTYRNEVARKAYVRCMLLGIQSSIVAQRRRQAELRQETSMETK